MLRSTGTTLMVEAFDWLHENYSQYRFFQERDIEWTLQIHLQEQIEKQDLPLEVHHNYPVLLSAIGKRSKQADLVLLNCTVQQIEAAIELKYEPSHNRRHEFRNTKFPVAFWNNPKGSVEVDIQRIQDFVKSGKVQTAFAVFIDEGCHYRHRAAFPGSQWIDWGAIGPDGCEVSVLWAEAGQAALHR